MKRFFIFTYPKLTIYVVAVFVAYFVFQIPAVNNTVSSFESIYLPIFFGGLLFSAGFTTPIATGFFLALDPANIYAASLVAGIGALIADLGIFSFVRLSFMDEFKKMKNSTLIKHIISGAESIVPKKLRSFLVYILVILIIASPLPDEIGVAMLAGFTRIHPYGFALISYIGNTLGIYLLLSIL